MPQALLPLGNRILPLSVAVTVNFNPHLLQEPEAGPSPILPLHPVFRPWTPSLPQGLGPQLPSTQRPKWSGFIPSHIRI